MARVLITCDGVERRVPAVPAMLIGRQHTCTLVLAPPVIPREHPELPREWVRVGWMDSPVGYRWAVGEPTGPARPWTMGREFERGGVSMALVNDDPPADVAVNRNNWEFLEGEAFAAVAEPVAGGWLPVLSAGPLIPFGGTLAIGSTAWTLYAGDPAGPTVIHGPDLLADDVYLDIDLDAQTATFRQAGRSPVCITGRDAMIVWVFADKRNRNLSDDGTSSLRAARELSKRGHLVDADSVRKLVQGVRDLLQARGVANTRGLLVGALGGPRALRHCTISAERIRIRGVY